MASEKESKPATKEKEKKAAAPRAPKGVRLPVLWETVNTLSQLTITFTGLAVAVVSFFNGNNILMCAVRAGAAMLSIGIVLYIIYWMIARGSMDMMFSLYKERQNEIKQHSSGNSTMEYNG